MSKLQATRNANQLIISLRYAINANDKGRIQATVDRAKNLEFENIEEEVLDEFYEIYDSALSILNIN